jgi:hypothetical protein
MLPQARSFEKELVWDVRTRENTPSKFVLHLHTSVIDVCTCVLHMWAHLRMHDELEDDAATHP